MIGVPQWRIVAATVLLSSSIVMYGQLSSPPASEHTQTPIFLSDHDKVYAYLEAVQRSAYANDPKAYRWTGEPKDVRTVYGILDQIGCGESDPTCTANDKDETARLRKLVLANLAKPVPTRWEEPVSYSILQNVVSEVEKTQEDRVKSTMPRFGTLPTTTLNARTVIVPGTKLPLMVLNSQLFSFSYESLKVYLDLVNIHSGSSAGAIVFDSDTFNKGPSANEDIVFRLSQVWEDATSHRRIIEHTKPKADTEILLSEMIDAIEFFVVAHEYGHIVLHHSTGRASTMSLAGISDVKMLENQRTWAQEIDADHFACELLDQHLALKYQGGDPNGLRSFLRLAPQFFFILETQSRIAQVLSETHDLPAQPTEEEENTITFRMHSLADTSSQRRQLTTPPTTDPYLIRVFSDGHPPAWARFDLVQEYDENHPWHTADMRVNSYRRFGETVLNHARRMGDTVLLMWLEEFDQTKGRAAYTNQMKGGWLRD